MQETQSISLERAHTQRKDEWTRAEKECLGRIARGHPGKATLLALFPGRSLNAIRLRLHLKRRELGLTKHLAEPDRVSRSSGPTMLDRDDPGLASTSWQEKQRKRNERVNGRFLEALRNAA